jgi:hypothetical protein
MAFENTEVLYSPITLVKIVWHDATYYLSSQGGYVVYDGNTYYSIDDVYGQIVADFVIEEAVGEIPNANLVLTTTSALRVYLKDGTWKGASITIYQGTRDIASNSSVTINSTWNWKIDDWSLSGGISKQVSLKLKSDPLGSLLDESDPYNFSSVSQARLTTTTDYGFEFLSGDNETTQSNTGGTGGTTLNTDTLLTRQTNILSAVSAY